MIITIDIETIPVQRIDIIDMLTAEAAEDLDNALAAVRAPSNYKDEKKIAEYIETTKAKLAGDHVENTKAFLARTSLDGSYGQVVCAAYAIEEEDPIAIIDSEQGFSFADEKKVLRAFFAKMREARGEPVIVGHNVNAFDLAFLYKRAVIHSVVVPEWWPTDPKPWGDHRTFDTMTRWAGAKGYIGLRRLAKILGLESMDFAADIDGSMVWDLVKAGKLDVVASKAIEDVDLARSIYRRMQFETR